MTFEQFLFNVDEATKPNIPLEVALRKLSNLYLTFQNTEIALNQLLAAVNKTIDENGHLADGEKCTLWRLKQAIGME